MSDLLHDFLHYTGADNVSGPWYGFWSGFGGDVSELALIGGVFTLWRAHNCEAKGCWRIARHTTLGSHKVCRRHHPDHIPTADEILAAHGKAQQKLLDQVPDTHEKI